jgi:hypothetical protein
MANERGIGQAESVIVILWRCGVVAVLRKYGQIFWKVEPKRVIVS